MKTETDANTVTHPEGQEQNSTPRPVSVETIPASLSWTKAESASLMERVVDPVNMEGAYRKVVANKGAPGVDSMTVHQLAGHLKQYWPTLRERLLADAYHPSPIRATTIPKPKGGTRQLGIPTVTDRLIQQALSQVLMPIFDPGFSESSYGYRPKRSAKQAVSAMKAHVTAGHRWVVDLDLEAFFDRVNHDLLMARVARRVDDKRVLRLIRRYLEAGMFQHGLPTPRRRGTPQGGPLSPLLANILLDDMDKALERRGHRFCRYADDLQVYVRSRRAGERVMASLSDFLGSSLKLTVNRAKSAVDRPWNRGYLGYTLTRHKRPKLTLAKASLQHLMQRVREILKRGRGRNIRRVIEELTPVLRGWASYFSLVDVKRPLEALDQWMRRRLRCVIWRQWKRPQTRRRKLLALGLDEQRAWRSAGNGRGPWWNAGASHMNQALPRKWFDRLGLISVLDTVRWLSRSS
ncbi:group II intron reverse transcriptase/maturase [Vreelandella aquamarina]|uniref:RNA-directed DNA polymerase n=1 Tax=Vreelandella aquamarina TaxID=77097 RepID=A0A1N6CSM7_9GAMM|nr:group II intron reverse transcriptase/maturase [Halomonas meridiana]SIN60382.1 group II intron reverse transcriptase/maturase [Halomonas meridiana]SIN61513.1 group II intron reverse transcriptase/maturase [Halomonas meridiana]SIN66936.1 group II intron reverse transcriptase/maturase [Halomonas meridiana]SIN67300.1 group II intron reverse transcriptase/maturase [Halomonas meridiana]SIN96669.1 group II intron reverse transcriptase/maturase [Halomonas meridiana]